MKLLRTEADMVEALPLIDERFELYRIITDYEALQDGFLDRIDDLDTTLALPSFADGVVQKLLTKNSSTMRSDRPSTPTRRTFGWESLGKMLKDTGLALVLVVDDARFAPAKEQLAKRRRINKPPNGSMKRPTWLFTRGKSLKMQVLRNQKLSPKQRKMIAKKAAKARWRKDRLALAAKSLPPQLGQNGLAVAIDGNIQRPMAHELP